MLVLTPTMLGSLFAGVALWPRFWGGVNHVDSIPYLNQYLSRKMVLDWNQEESSNNLDMSKTWIGHSSLKRIQPFSPEDEREVLDSLVIKSDRGLTGLVGLNASD